MSYALTFILGFVSCYGLLLVLSKRRESSGGADSDEKEPVGESNVAVIENDKDGKQTIKSED